MGFQNFEKDPVYKPNPIEDESLAAAKKEKPNPIAALFGLNKPGKKTTPEEQRANYLALRKKHDAAASEELTGTQMDELLKTSKSELKSRFETGAEAGQSMRVVVKAGPNNDQEFVFAFSGFRKDGQSIDGARGEGQGSIGGLIGGVEDGQKGKAALTQLKADVRSDKVDLSRVSADFKIVEAKNGHKTDTAFNVPILTFLLGGKELEAVLKRSLDEMSGGDKESRQRATVLNPEAPRNTPPKSETASSHGAVGGAEHRLKSQTEDGATPIKTPEDASHAGASSSKSEMDSTKDAEMGNPASAREGQVSVSKGAIGGNPKKEKLEQERQGGQ